tara:strand:- start:523 stop:897 length:375 start_codon:yes stop_codon:yes gene_type:complete
MRQIIAILKDILMKKDNQLLVLTHLSQLLDYVTGIGGFIVPLILWLTKKDDIEGMDLHGKAILNFRISIFIYLILCIPLVLLLGLGILGIIAIAVIAFIFPIVNAIKANKGEAPKYPFSIPFIK